MHLGHQRIIVKQWRQVKQMKLYLNRQLNLLHRLLPRYSFTYSLTQNFFANYACSIQLTNDLFHDVFGIASILAVFVCSFVSVCSDAVRHYVGNGVTRTSKVLTLLHTYSIIHSLIYLLSHLFYSFLSVLNLLTLFIGIRTIYE